MLRPSPSAMVDKSADKLLFGHVTISQDLGGGETGEHKVRPYFMRISGLLDQVDTEVNVSEAGIWQISLKEC